jgi:hypothetical protein
MENPFTVIGFTVIGLASCCWGGGDDGGGVLSHETIENDMHAQSANDAN